MFSMSLRWRFKYLSTSTDCPDAVECSFRPSKASSSGTTGEPVCLRFKLVQRATNCSFKTRTPTVHMKIIVAAAWSTIAKQTETTRNKKREVVGCENQNFPRKFRPGINNQSSSLNPLKRLAIDCPRKIRHLNSSELPEVTPVTHMNALF